MEKSQSIISDDSLSALRTLLGTHVSSIYSSSLEVRGSFVYSWSFSMHVHENRYRYVLKGKEFVKTPTGDDRPEQPPYLVLENKPILSAEEERHSRAEETLITIILPGDFRRRFQLSAFRSPLPKGIKVHIEEGREPALISPSTIDLSMSDIASIIVCEGSEIGSNAYDKAIVFRDDYDGKFAIMSQYSFNLAFTSKKKNIKSIVKTASRKIKLA